VVAPLGEDRRGDVIALVERATLADGVGPLSEHSLLHLHHGDSPTGADLVALTEGNVAGYAHVDRLDPGHGAGAELVVDPDLRCHGIGRALMSAVDDAAAGGPLHLWAHGRLPGAAAFADRLGLVEDRTLLRMTRPLGPGADELPEPAWPATVVIATFRVGRDEAAWLEVNKRAFVGLPDQGGWTVDDLQVREAESWFDPSGFFLAWRGDELLGFHWTKVHGGGTGHRHDPIGEVYVVGVDPAAQGTGLGRSLTVQGLRHLQDRGLREAMLYVDGDNASAIALYTALGFTTRDVDVRYATPVKPNSGAR
jgi:mycothiol synthase